jgi:hypothetical protein
MKRFLIVLALYLLAVASTPGFNAAIAGNPASVRILDWLAPVPAGWIVQVPSSSMRVAQFNAESAEGKADIAVFHFGAAGGGTVQGNIDRWASQFTTADGQPAKPVVERSTASGMPVTWVALDGRYARGVGTGPQGEAAANQSLRVAIVETPKGNLFFQLWGDRAAVARQEGSLREVVQGLRRGPGG